VAICKAEENLFPFELEEMFDFFGKGQIQVTFEI